MTYLLVSCGAVIFINVVLPILNGLVDALLSKLGKLSTKDQCEAAMYTKDLESYGMENEQHAPAIGFKVTPQNIYEEEE